ICSQVSASGLRNRARLSGSTTIGKSQCTVTEGGAHRVDFGIREHLLANTDLTAMFGNVVGMQHQLIVGKSDLAAKEPTDLAPKMLVTRCLLARFVIGRID